MFWSKNFNVIRIDQAGYIAVFKILLKLAATVWKLCDVELILSTDMGVGGVGYEG